MREPRIECRGYCWNWIEFRMYIQISATGFQQWQNEDRICWMDERRKRRKRRSRKKRRSVIFVGVRTRSRARRDLIKDILVDDWWCYIELLYRTGNSYFPRHIARNVATITLFRHTSAMFHLLYWNYLILLDILNTHILFKIKLSNFNFNVMRLFFIL